MNNADNIFIVYNAAGASDFHAEIVASLRSTRELPEALADLLTAKEIVVDGATRWIVDFA